MKERNKTLGNLLLRKRLSIFVWRIISNYQFDSISIKVVYKVNKAGLVDIVGDAGEQNIQGEDQQKLDVYAMILFKH
jgi:fructose-1,6-bisphosphatase I